MNTWKKTTIIRLFTPFFLLLTAVCQCGGLLPRIFGANAFLLLPAVVCICMFESEIASVCFGLFAGALWDYSASFPDGSITLLLGLTALCCSLLMRFYLRRNLSAAFACGGTVLFVFSILFSFLAGVPGAERGSVFLWFYLPSAIYSAVFIPLYYYIFKALYGDKSKERVI